MRSSVQVFQIQAGKYEAEEVVEVDYPLGPPRKLVKIITIIYFHIILNIMTKYQPTSS